ncbi:MAG: alpha/beta hydrolase [Bryobacteraceae bacterium]
MTSIGVPSIHGGTGDRSATIFFGVNALFRRLDTVRRPDRYAKQIEQLLPGYRFTILGYTGGQDFNGIVESMAAAIGSAPDLLIGISFGGIVALRFAAQHPELTRRLVLLSSAHRFSLNGQRMLRSQFEALERHDLASLARENALLFRRPWYNWLLRAKLAMDASKMAEQMRAPDAILEDYRRLFGPEFERNADFARQVQCPTLLLCGGGDQVFDSAACQETARLIPNCRLQLFGKETHMLPIERSADVARAIADFTKEKAGPV